MGPDFNLTAAFAIVVFGEISHASRGKIREDAESFSLEMINRRAAQIVEIMRQDLRRETDRDTLGALEQHDGKFSR